MAKLSEMKRPQLNKLAKKYGIRTNSRMKDNTLRTKIQQTRRELRDAKKVAKPEPETFEASGWPTAWPEEYRAEYYRSIVGKPMPGTARVAYRRLMAQIDKRLPKETPRMTEAGLDCFGIEFELPLLRTCQMCPDMPLCRAVCEARPDFKELADNIDEAADEVEQMSEDDFEEAVKVVTEAKPKKRRRRKSSAVSYKWQGDLEWFEENVEGDLVEVYQWLASVETFTEAELAKQMSEFSDSKQLAKDTLEYLVSEDDVVPV